MIQLLPGVLAGRLLSFQASVLCRGCLPWQACPARRRVCKTNLICRRIVERFPMGWSSYGEMRSLRPVGRKCRPEPGQSRGGSQAHWLTAQGQIVSRGCSLVVTLVSSMDLFPTEVAGTWGTIICCLPGWALAGHWMRRKARTPFQDVLLQDARVRLACILVSHVMF